MHTPLPRHVVLAALLLSLFAGCASPPPKKTGPSLQEIAEEAYVFGYPLVLMDITTRVMTAPGRKVRVNEFDHKSRFPDASFTDVVSPNCDTFYSMAVLNLGPEPIVLSVPDTKGRYYLMPILDAWTNVFASPGKRTTGTGKGDFAFVGPTWTGTLPSGVQEIRSPTDLAWIIGRTQVNSKADAPAVVALQRQYRLTPLSRWGKPAGPAAAVPITPVNSTVPPVQQVEMMDAATFFGRLASLMKANPPASEDSAALSRFTALGLLPGEDFDLAARDTAIQGAMNRAVPAALAKIKGAEGMIGNRTVNGWLVSTGLGKYGTQYLKRAYIARVGLGANLDEDAIYPHTSNDIDGPPLNGARSKYVLHFTKDQRPPVDAFWSLTMYNDKNFLAENPIHRYALGDRDALAYNADSSLDLYVQNDDPGENKRANWLPAPAGDFILVMRLYWPKPPATDGTWQPPPIRKAATP
jgi:hypothetical protein